MSPVKKAKPAKERMANYRRRMRASGLRAVQVWVSDNRNPAFVEKCRRQAEAAAKFDPTGDELMQFVADVYEWPEP